MAGGGPSIGSYSPLTGFVFIFNLIVGAGALTIPHAFANVSDDKEEDEELLYYNLRCITVS